MAQNGKSIGTWVQVLIGVATLIITLGTTMIANATANGEQREDIKDHERRIDDLEKRDAATADMVRIINLKVQRIADAFHVHTDDIK